MPLLTFGPLLAGMLTTGVAEPPSPSDDPPARFVETGHAPQVALRLGNAGWGAAVGWRMRTKRAIGVGLEIETVYYPTAYIGGLAVDDDLSLWTRVPLTFPVYRSASFTMAINAAPGFRYLRSFEAGVAESYALSTTLDFGVGGYIHGKHLTWMLAMGQELSVQLRPIQDLNFQATVLSTGPIVPITDRWQFFATVDAGGAFGSDGDAGKFLIRGTAGVRATFGASARDWRVIY